MSATTGFLIGSSLFAFGSYTNQNAFLGFAGNTSTTGLGNTAAGDQALACNTTGNYNTADGGAALQGIDTNTQECLGNTPVTGNTAVGSGALQYDTTGNYNTAIGFASGHTGNGSDVTQSNNTVLGAGATLSTGTLTNATAIGSNAVVGESNALVLGCLTGYAGCPTGVSVGIGTASPSAPLHINGPAGPPPSSQPFYNNGLLLGSNGTSSYKWIQTYGGPLILNAVGNNVGIGTTAPDTLLSVNGGADKPGGGSWATFSDGRLKNLNGNFSSGLSQVLKLNPVRYRYKPDNAMGIRDMDEHVGLVAQDVQKAIPEAVTENSKGYLLVNNDPIIWAMLNAIKEQQGEFRQQQAELAKATAESPSCAELNYAEFGG